MSNRSRGATYEREVAKELEAEIGFKFVHHREPHRGDETLFYDALNLEAVCWQCHSGAIQSEEALGYDATIGADGWPTDPKHPGTR